MNPFGQIIDLTGINGIEPGKAAPGTPDNGDSKNLGIDFLQILGGKLSGDLPMMFGETAETVESEAGISDEILKGNSTELQLAGVPIELGEIESEKLSNQNILIAQKEISTVQFLNIKVDGEVNSLDKSSNIEVILPTEQNAKTENLSPAINQTILSSDKKFNDLNPNSMNSGSTQIDINKSNSEIRPAVLAEIDAELSPKNNSDIRTTNLLDKVTGSLNIKNVKLEKNSENNTTDKEPVKLSLPTKSYIKVSTVETNTSGNNSQFANSNQNMFQSNTEIVVPETEISKSEQIKLNNFEAVARMASDQSSVKIETGQLTNQPKLISNITPVLTNGSEKIEMVETKVETLPVKFVVPTEINGNNIKNNHTVMIRMEPDHLGPVRMTVSTHNDTLTARLIVDSPLARATVESNLNNLVEQLDKQGIKIESLEVSVGGGNDGSEAKENRFANASRTIQQNLKNYENSNVIDEVMTQRAQEQLYIDTSGVNCFA
ncbi:MAG: flagellar hook-length control protein FliK [candidate division Zixibacteria bacterium]|nr:flagellar hook-length control protein FliK [candidate division Zixibacteria bacterium]